MAAAVAPPLAEWLTYEQAKKLIRRCHHDVLCHNYKLPADVLVDMGKAADIYKDYHTRPHHRKQLNHQCVLQFIRKERKTRDLGVNPTSSKGGTHKNVLSIVAAGMLKLVTEIMRNRDWYVTKENLTLTPTQKREQQIADLKRKLKGAQLEKRQERRKRKRAELDKGQEHRKRKRAESKDLKATRALDRALDNLDNEKARVAELTLENRKLRRRCQRSNDSDSELSRSRSEQDEDESESESEGSRSGSDSSCSPVSGSDNETDA